MKQLTIIFLTLSMMCVSRADINFSYNGINFVEKNQRIMIPLYFFGSSHIPWVPGFSSLLQCDYNKDLKTDIFALQEIIPKVISFDFENNNAQVINSLPSDTGLITSLNYGATASDFDGDGFRNEIFMFSEGYDSDGAYIYGAILKLDTSGKISLLALNNVMERMENFKRFNLNTVVFGDFNGDNKDDIAWLQLDYQELPDTSWYAPWINNRGVYNVFVHLDVVEALSSRAVDGISDFAPLATEPIVDQAADYFTMTPLDWQGPNVGGQVVFDFNGDGLDDLMIYDTRHRHNSYSSLTYGTSNLNFNDRILVYVSEGDRFTLSFDELQPADNFFRYGLRSSMSTDDVNNDGNGDFIFIGHDLNTNNAALCVRLSDGISFLQEEIFDLGPNVFVSYGTGSGELVGWDERPKIPCHIVNTVDLNNDGTKEILVTSYRGQPNDGQGDAYTRVFSYHDTNGIQLVHEFDLGFTLYTNTLNSTFLGMKHDEPLLQIVPFDYNGDLSMDLMYVYQTTDENGNWPRVAPGGIYGPTGVYVSIVENLFDGNDMIESITQFNDNK